jgi:hypothetical protein
MKYTRREVLQAGCAVVSASAVGKAAGPVPVPGLSKG